MDLRLRLIRLIRKSIVRFEIIITGLLGSFFFGFFHNFFNGLFNSFDSFRRFNSLRFFTSFFHEAGGVATKGSASFLKVSRSSPPLHSAAFCPDTEHMCSGFFSF